MLLFVELMEGSTRSLFHDPKSTRNWLPWEDQSQMHTIKNTYTHIHYNIHHCSWKNFILEQFWSMLICSILIWRWNIIPLYFLYSMYENLCEYKRKYEENGTRKGKEASIIRTNTQLFSFLSCYALVFNMISKARWLV